MSKRYPAIKIWKIETFIKEDTGYKKHCTQDNDVSVPFKVGTLGPHTVLPVPISCPIVFSWISWAVWNLFPFKGHFSFGKSQKSQGTKSGCRGPESPEWFAISQKKFCTRRDAWAGALSRWSCQSPVAHSCSLLNHPDSFHRGMFKFNATSDADSSLYSVILNVMATHCTCSFNSIYTPTV